MMKRNILVFLAALMIAILFCSCMQQTASDAKDMAETMVKGVESAAENGKTDQDTDGFLEGNDMDQNTKPTNASEPTVNPEEMTQNVTDVPDGKMINGTEVTENNDFV